MHHYSRGTLTVACAVAATFVLCSTAHAKKTTFIAVLNGGAEVPPTTSNAMGNAFMTFDSETSQLCYAISYSDLSSAEVAAHFHGPATPTEDANVIAGGDISPMPPGPSPLGSPKQGCVTLDAEGAKMLKKGLVYVNIHSVDISSGEIRGQVLPQKPKY